MIWLCIFSVALSFATPAPTSLDWNTSVIAQGLRPGIQVGVEKPLREWERTRKGLWRTHLFHRQLVFEPGFSGWYHRNNHTPMSVDGRLRIRRTRSSGLQREFFIGQGFTYAINAGRTYWFDEDDTLQSSRLAGRAMRSSVVGFGMGMALTLADGSDIAWHLRPTLTVWNPYNAGLAPVWTVEVGVRRSWGRS
jgi:hypothetical protein